MPHSWHIAREGATGHTAPMAAASLPPRRTAPVAAEESGNWSPSSWRRFEARQQPDYPDPAALLAAERELADYPPLVAFREIDALRHALAGAQSGRAFLLQGGDCAESFAEFSSGNIDANLALLKAMAERVGAVFGRPIIRLGRMAGQFAKPRSADTETRGGLSLPAYRGDIVNGIAFDARARRPDPERMFRAYAQAAATRSRIGAAAYTSHEALLLPFEQALVRTDPETGRAYATSAHFLWIGDRTRFAGSAHVEFARGLANPIGIKCGPSLDGETLLGLLETLDPAREPGRITLIARMGWDRIETALPPLLRAVRGSGRSVLWSCDPMHGNTIRTALGSKTRPLDRILAETRAFFAIATAEGVRCAGLHFEMTGRDVAECTGGGVAPGDPDMADRYHTHCDPRLNPAQAMALADLAAGCLAEAGSFPAAPEPRSEPLPSAAALG
jgi:3-deoxy-7-phosphoheptulonate synthase